MAGQEAHPTKAIENQSEHEQKAKPNAKLETSISAGQVKDAHAADPDRFQGSIVKLDARAVAAAHDRAQNSGQSFGIDFGDGTVETAGGKVGKTENSAVAVAESPKANQVETVNEGQKTAPTVDLAEMSEQERFKFVLQQVQTAKPEDSRPATTMEERFVSDKPGVQVADKHAPLQVQDAVLRSSDVDGRGAESAPLPVPGEIHAGEIRPSEIRPGEIHAGEIHAGEIHAGEIHAGEIHAGEIHPGEIHPGEIHEDDSKTKEQASAAKFLAKIDPQDRTLEKAVKSLKHIEDGQEQYARTLSGKEREDAMQVLADIRAQRMLAEGSKIGDARSASDDKAHGQAERTDKADGKVLQLQAEKTEAPAKLHGAPQIREAINTQVEASEKFDLNIKYLKMGYSPEQAFAQANTELPAYKAEQEQERVKQYMTEHPGITQDKAQESVEKQKSAETDRIVQKIEQLQTARVEALEKSGKSPADAENLVGQNQQEFEKDVALFETTRRQQLQTKFELCDGMNPAAAKASADKEINDTYDKLLHLTRDECTWKLNGQPGLTGDARSELVGEIIHQAANPTEINQGYHNTCNMTTLEVRGYTREPSRVASMITEVALTGKSTLLNKNEPVDLPLDNLENKFKQEDRTFASTIFETTAVNLYYISQGSPTRYIQTDQIVDRPTGSQTSDTGERLYDGAARTKWEQNHDPGAACYSPSIMEVGRIISENPGLLLADGKTVSPEDAKHAVVPIESAEDLKVVLEQLKADGEFPIIVQVCAYMGPFRKELSPDFKVGSDGGGHVVTIAGYDDSDPKNPRIFVDNQWSNSEDKLYGFDAAHTGFKDGRQMSQNPMTLDDLFTAMQTPYTRDIRALESLRPALFSNMSEDKQREALQTACDEIQSDLPFYNDPNAAQQMRATQAGLKTFMEAANSPSDNTGSSHGVSGVEGPGLVNKQLESQFLQGHLHSSVGFSSGGNAAMSDFEATGLVNRQGQPILNGNAAVEKGSGGNDAMTDFEATDSVRPRDSVVKLNAEVNVVPTKLDGANEIRQNVDSQIDATAKFKLESHYCKLGYSPKDSHDKASSEFSAYKTNEEQQLIKQYIKDHPGITAEKAQESLQAERKQSTERITQKIEDLQTARLQTLEKSGMAPAEAEKLVAQQQQQLERDVTLFETTRREQLQSKFELSNKMTPEEAKRSANDEINKTYDSMFKLLQGECTWKVNGQPGLNGKERSQLVGEVIHQAANPTSIDQGYHNTCNMTTLEVRAYTREPSVVASLITEVALTGKTSILNRDKAPVDLPLDNLKPWEFKDEKRSFASDIFESTAVNLYYIDKGSPTRYIQTDKINDKKGHDDTGERLYDGATRKKWEAEHGPGEAGKPSSIMEVGRIITHDPGTIFVDSELVSAGDSKHAVTAIDSPEKLKQELEQAKRNGDFPIVVQVCCYMEPFCKDAKLTHAEKGGGEHVVTIAGYDDSNPKNPKIYVDNQWGDSLDKLYGFDEAHTGFSHNGDPKCGRPMSVDELFTAMQFPESRDLRICQSLLEKEDKHGFASLRERKEEYTKVYNLMKRDLPFYTIPELKADAKEAMAHYKTVMDESLGLNSSGPHPSQQVVENGNNAMSDFDGTDLVIPQGRPMMNSSGEKSSGENSAMTDFESTNPVNRQARPTMNTNPVAAGASGGNSAMSDFEALQGGTNMADAHDQFRAPTERVKANNAGDTDSEDSEL